MAEKIFEVIKNNLKNPKFYGWILLVIILAWLLFPYVDANYFYFKRVGKRIEILKQMTELDRGKIDDNPVLKEEYLTILSEIKKQKTGSVAAIFIFDETEEVFRNKLLSGGAITWILALVYVFSKNLKKSQRIVGFILLVVIGFLIGFLMAKIPTIISPWGNYILVPILQCVIIGLFVSRGDKGKKHEKEAKSKGDL